MKRLQDGNIPVLQVHGNGIADMWERSVVRLYNDGMRIETEYDREGDPLSYDCTMTMVADNPFAEPMIHKAFPGGPEDLEEYKQEVVDGIKDDWVDLDSERWKYTYHGRLANYECYKREVHTHRPVGTREVTRRFVQLDQLAEIVKKLAASPHSRRAYAPTGQPWIDWSIPDPPCCLGVWFRIMFDHLNRPHLNMNVTFRSRDAYDAAFMNVWGFVHLQARMAQRISEKMGVEVLLGRYCDTSFSYHIYGNRLRGGKPPTFEEGFLKMMENRWFADPNDPSHSRTARYEDWAPMFEEAKPKILEKLAAHATAE